MEEGLSPLILPSGARHLPINSGYQVPTGCAPLDIHTSPAEPSGGGSPRRPLGHTRSLPSKALESLNTQNAGQDKMVFCTVNTVTSSTKQSREATSLAFVR